VTVEDEKGIDCAGSIVRVQFALEDRYSLIIRNKSKIPPGKDHFLAFD
jgi:hypothetical protein